MYIPNISHLGFEDMDKKDRLRKLMMIYSRVQRWIQIYKGTKSPSEMNIAQGVLREIEELTARVDNGFFKSIPPDMIEKLNRYWKQYKY
jgi:hypothetical protein